MSYKSIPRRAIRTGLYTDRAVELVKKVLAVCCCRFPKTKNGENIRMAINVYSSVYRDPSGEVVIGNSENAINVHYFENIFEERLHGLSDKQILCCIARAFKSGILKKCSPEEWRHDSRKSFKDKGSYYRVRLHLDPLQYMDDDDDDDDDYEECKLENVRVSLKDAYFIWAKLLNKTAELEKFPEAYIESFTGEPNDPVRYEVLKAVEDEIIDAIDDLLNRKRELNRQEDEEIDKAENAIHEAFVVKRRELNKDLVKRFNAAREAARLQVAEA